MAKPSTNILMAAIKERWTAQNVGSSFPGGILEHQIQERTARDYAVIQPTVDRTKTRTNCSHDEVELTIYVMTSTPERAGELLEILKAALDYAPLVLHGGDLLYFRNGTVSFSQEDQLEKASINYEALVARSVNYSPA